jgi:alpha-L-rhamnosidase
MSERILSEATFDASATWLGRNNPAKPSEPGTQAPSPLLRREFRLAGGVARAELQLATLGYSEAWINGQRVSDALLDPPLAQYDRTAYARTVDVTSLLREGDNVLGVALGRAYASGVGSAGTSWATEPRLLAQLDVISHDGDTQRIVSDGTWRMADGPTRDWMFLGEHHDARVGEPRWSEPSCDASSWPAATEQRELTRKVVTTTMPPVRLADTFGPVAVDRSDSGTTVYDFGKITAGWTRIEVEGDRGATVTLTYGQSRNDDGTVYTWLPNMHIDSYTLRGDGVETWEPRFTRHGFQYVEVAVAGEVVLQRIEARENYTHLPSTGRFASGNPLLDRLHQNQRRSLLLNHWGFPTDTSWRDRQGWTADTALFMDGAILNFADVSAVYENFLGTLRDAQLADGTTSIFAPDGHEYPVNNDPSWSGMLIMMPWTMYRYYGERRVLEDNYEAMTRWMDLMETSIAATGDLYAGFSFGDHSPPGAEDAGTIEISPPEGSDITRNGHLYLEARTLAKIARLLGRDADAARYDAMADRIAPAFHAAYFDATENVYRNPSQEGYRQTSNLAPLAWGLVPEEHVDAVFANLVADLEVRGNRLNTGAIGTKLLLPVLTAHGRSDLAYLIATQTEYPSWGYWVTQGANSSWETWSHQGPEQTFDHPFLATFEEWLFQHLAGIQAAEPGYAKVRIAPVFPAGLDHASAAVTTPHGVVSSGWRRQNGHLTLVVDVPTGIPAEIVTPYPGERVQIVHGRASVSETSDSLTTCRTGSEQTVLRVREG